MTALLRVPKRHGQRDGAAGWEAALARLGDRAGQGRALVTALAWGRGPGLPQGLWVPVARALAGQDGQHCALVGEEDVRRLLRKGRGLVVRDTRPGWGLVCRVGDDGLAARLRGDPPGAAATAGGAGRRARCEALVTAALVESVAAGETGRDWAAAHPYLRAHLVGHAAAAGGAALSEVLADVGFLAVADPVSAGPLLSFPEAGLRDVGRAYWRVRGVLGDDPHINAALLAEAIRKVGGRSEPGSVAPAYRTQLALAARDDSLLTVPHVGGHPGSLNGLSVTAGPGGRPWGAVACDDGTVRVWDLLAGTLVTAPLRGHQGFVATVAATVTAQGRLLLASGGQDTVVRVWDVAAGACVAELTGHTGHVLGVSFGTVPGAEGRLLLASGSVDGSVRLWDPLAGTLVGEPLMGHAEVTNAFGAPDRTVNRVAFGVVPGEGEAGGRLLLASAGIDRTVRVWDPLTGTPVGAPLTGHARSVWGVAMCTVTRDGERQPLLASCGWDHTIRLWDPLAGTPVGEPLTGHTGPVENVAFGTVLGEREVGGGRLVLASASDDQTIRLWDPLAATPTGAALLGHTSYVNRVAFGTAPDGRLLLASVSDDSTLRLWEPVSPPVTRRGDGQARWVDAVALCWDGQPAGRLLAACADGAQGTVAVWDTLAGAPASTVAHSGRVLGLAFGAAPTGQPLLACAGEDKLVRVFDPATGALVAGPLAGHTREVRAVAFGTRADGGLVLASAGDDAAIWVWDPLAGAPATAPLAGHEGWAGAVAFGTVPGEGGAGGRLLLASGGEDGLVRVWDPLTGTATHPPMAGHDGAVHSVAFGTAPGAEGRLLLASAGDDTTVRLWDPLTGTPAGPPLAGHTGWVRAVCFAAGPAAQPLLVSAAGDQTLRVWDVAARSCLAVLPRTSPVRSLAVTGLTIAIGEDNGMTVLELDHPTLTA